MSEPNRATDDPRVRALLARAGDGDLRPCVLATQPDTRELEVAWVEAAGDLAHERVAVQEDHERVVVTAWTARLPSDLIFTPVLRVRVTTIALDEPPGKREIVERFEVRDEATPS